MQHDCPLVRVLDPEYSQTRHILLHPIASGKMRHSFAPSSTLQDPKDGEERVLDSTVFWGYDEVFLLNNLFHWQRHHKKRDSHPPALAPVRTLLVRAQETLGLRFSSSCTRPTSQDLDIMKNFSTQKIIQGLFPSAGASPQGVVRWYCDE